MTPGRTRNHIDVLTRHLVLNGLADDLQEAFERGTSNREITFGNANLISYALGNIPYDETYAYFAENRVFNARMLDGGLLQLTYLFQRDNVIKHRLAFLPSPELETFDWDPDLLRDDHEFSDIVVRRRSVQPTPIRFDFNSSDETHVDIVHPKSHLTLGNHSVCRIPVTSPVTPYWFLCFIIRNFYSTHTTDFATDLPELNGSFNETISSTEKSIPHVSIPR